MNNEIKLKIKKDIIEEWDYGFYQYESWRKINIKIINYFENKKITINSYIIKTIPPLYVLSLDWDETKTYEYYFTSKVS